jgi:Tol biopolymer transport system component
MHTTSAIPVSGIAQFSVAAAGTLAYLPGPLKEDNADNSNVLAFFDGKGGVEPLAVPRGLYRGVRVSPDGRTVAYGAGSGKNVDVWIQTLDLKTAARRLTFGGDYNDGPVWSPDGQWIAFQSNREGDLGLFRQRADGSGAAERLTTPQANAEHLALSWSPDGGVLLFAAKGKGTTYDLQMLSLKDRRVSLFSDVTGSIIRTEAAFSPDGRWVVYQRDTTGPRRLFGTIQTFVEPFPPTGAKYLVPVENAGNPFWSRRGDRLYFNTSPTTSVQVDIATTPTVTFSQPRPFSRDGRFEPPAANLRRQIDSLPDGRFLGVKVDDGGTKPEIHVVLNWQQALNAKLAH